MTSLLVILQEFECTSTNDTLNSMMDESKLSAKLGRVLRKGEYKIKIYELELNPTNAGEVNISSEVLYWVLDLWMSFSGIDRVLSFQHSFN